MSQAQLAGAELTKGFISQVESGLVRPSIRSLQLIAGRLGKSLDYFLGDEPLSLQKRTEFFALAAQAAFERRAWGDLAQVARDALSLELAPAARARFLRWRAHALLGAGDNDGAFAAAEEALRLLDPATDAEPVAWAMLVQGVAYANIGQIVAASQAFERGLDVVEAQEVRDVRLRTRLLLNLGTTYRRLNRTTKAVQLYEAALALANRVSDLHSVAQAFMGVAITMYDSGELDGAIGNYRKALELFRRVSDQRFEIDVLQSLAGVRFQQGKVAQAEEYAKAAQARALAVGDEHLAAVAEAELARVVLARGEAAEALRIARAAERVLARVGDTKQRAAAVRTIGAAHEAQKEHAAADRHYQQAIALAEGLQQFPDVSEYAAEYAQKLRERRDYEQAFAYLELARRHAAAPATRASARASS